LLGSVGKICIGESQREYSMRTRIRLLVVGAAILALGAWVLQGAGPGTAADTDKGPREDVRKIADLIEKGDTAAAKTQAKAVAAKADLEDVMHAFSLRSSKGEGIGPTPGAVKPDGIEAKIQNMTKRPVPAELKEHGAALQRACYIAAAVA